MNNSKYVIVAAFVAWIAIIAFGTMAHALQVAEPPTLKQVLEITKLYNESVDESLKVTLNFNHPEYPILIPEKSLGSDGGAANIEKYIRDTHNDENYGKVSNDNNNDDKKEQQHNCGIVHPNCKSTVEMNEEDNNDNGGGSGGSDDDDNGEWTQKKFDEKYGDSLPDDGTLDSDD